MKKKPVEKATASNEVPRRRAVSEIRLLRLEMIPTGSSFFEEIGSVWFSVQPAESLSPYKAAECLGVGVWSPQSVVKKRYQILQLRYPPDQFVEQHTQWRPAALLLADPSQRLNWFWQSGFLPAPCDEPSITPQAALRRLLGKDTG